MSLGQKWPTASLVAGYHCADVNDFSGNSKTLTNGNSVTFLNNGLGKCAHFVAASNQSLYRASSIITLLNAAWTIKFRIMIVTAPTDANSYGILWIYQYNNVGIEVVAVYYKNVSGVYQIQINPGTVGVSITANYTFTLNKWYDMTLVCSGAYSSTLYLYVNGSLVTSGATGNNNFGSSGGYTYIGGHTSGSYNGVANIDEFLMYNYSMKANQIRREHAMTRGMLI